MVGGYHLPVFCHTVGMLYPRHAVVKQKRLACRLHRSAACGELGAVVLSGVQGTAVPRQSDAGNSVQCPRAVEHRVKLVISRIAVIALREDTKPGKQTRVKKTFLRIGKLRLTVEKL